jgi:hypothetical protein
VAEEGQGENEVVQSVNPAANVQLMLQPTLHLMLQQTFQPMLPATSSTTQLTPPTSKGTPP